MADIAAVEARNAFVEHYRPNFFYDGVNYADALKYDLLLDFLPEGDPGLEAAADHP